MLILSTDDEGTVLLEQQDNSGNKPSIIAIHPGQIDMIIRWLQESKQSTGS
jgi:hypothetical protein